MSAIEQQDSHRPPSDGGMAKEEFIRVGTTLYKIVEQPRLNGGYVRKRIAWNNETLRQDYGKDYIGSVPKYDGFCTVPEHIGYRSVVGKFLNLYEPIDHRPQEGDLSHIQSLVRHIFGEQYELGMDYLQLLYLLLLLTASICRSLLLTLYRNFAFASAGMPSMRRTERKPKRKLRGKTMSLKFLRTVILESSCSPEVDIFSSNLQRSGLSRKNQG